MKKTIATLLILFISLGLMTACFNPDNGEPSGDRVKLKVGYLTGPTGMGMAKLIVDNNGLDGGNENYEFIKYPDSQTAMGDLSAGKVDVICLATNEAAKYYEKSKHNAKILALNCLNSLYLVSEIGEGIGGEGVSLADFEGKTIYTCKNGTPRAVLEYIIKELGLNITVSTSVNGNEMDTPFDVRDQIVANNIPNAVIPEPLVSTVITNINASATLRPAVSAVVNLSDAWSKISDSPIAMGCLVTRADFADKNKQTLNLFLNEYSKSVEYISDEKNFDSAANYILETGIIPKLPIARGALYNLRDSLVYIDGDAMKSILISFYEAMNIALPDESIYYEK